MAYNVLLYYALYSGIKTFDWIFILTGFDPTLSVFYHQRLIQYLASRNTLFNLNNFLDKGALQGTVGNLYVEAIPHHTVQKSQVQNNIETCNE